MKAVIARLLTKKKAGNELDTGKSIPVISDSLNNEISLLAVENERPAVTKNYEKLNRLFIETIKKINGANL